MKLNYRVMGEGKPLIILHGLFGSADNWQTLGKSFSEKFQVYLVDQRNHGNSPHSEEFNYDLMADDLYELIQSNGIQKAHLLGHSMGGKTAMTFSVKYPKLVEKLVVVDIGPKPYPPHHENIFNGFKSVKLDEIQTRKEADDQIAILIPEFGIRQFILKNLTRDDNGKFTWKVNLTSLESNILEIGRALDDSDSFTGDTLFIGGANSNYILPEDEEMILRHFPKAILKMISGSGHWVHAEKPQELYDEVMNFLQQNHD